MEPILFVANDYPYPPHHGAAVDTWNLVLGLKQLGFSLDLVATVRNQPKRADIDIVQGIVDQLWIVERNTSVSSVLSLTPFQVCSRRALQSVALKKTYSAVLLKSEYVAPILKNMNLSARVRILRAENDEARYFRELSKSADNRVARYFYRAEAAKFGRFSPLVRAECDLLWFVSDWERACHVQQRPEDSQKAIFMPSGSDVKRMRPYSREGKDVLFVGGLTIPLNLEGLEWYIANVHPKLLKLPEYSFTIAGRTGGVSNPLLQRMISGHSSISLCADPQDLTRLYSRAAVFVNPVLRGAGVKVKTSHALHAGVPVVSTSIGMEGTGLIKGTHLLVADSPGEFAQDVARLLRNRELAERLVRAAQSFLAETYNYETNLRRSLSSVLSVPGQRRDVNHPEKATSAFQ
jgi:glycosyltransferase involved in cell wall biosynthesis